MLKKLLNISMVSIMVLTMVSCGDTQESAILTEKVYQNEEYLFELRVPATFLRLPEEQTPSDVIVSYLDILHKVDNFTPNFVLMKEAKEYPDMDILVYAQGYVDKTTKTVQGYEQVSLESIEILGKLTKYHIYYADKDGKRYKFIQTFFEVNNTVFIFTAILGADSTADDDLNYIDIINTIKAI